MKTRITAAPSPRGTNNERLFLVKVPRGSNPQGALDAMLKHGRDEHDDKRDAELRTKLEEMLMNCLAGEELEAALSMLDEHLPSQHYGDVDGADDDEHETEGRERIRKFLADKGASDEEIDDLFTQMDEEMPRNGREGGMGGRLAELEGRDRRRGAKDRRRPAMDASQSFDQRFPGARRITNAISFK